MMHFLLYNVLWSALLFCGFPVAALVLPFRRRYCSGLLQRLGFLPRNLKKKVEGQRVVWLHAASVGEVFSLQPLIGSLRRRHPEMVYVLSTCTRSGFETARKSLTEIDGAFYLPLDHPWAVRRVLRRLRPSLLILTETEIWPNLIRLASLAKARVLLVSGRLSVRSYRKYSAGFSKKFFATVVSYISCFCMQSEDDAERITRLGADRTRVMTTGNLKFVRTFEPTGVEETVKRKELGISKERAVVIGGSTHAGEENMILRVYRRLKEQKNDLLLILAPRHPERFSEVEGLIRRSGFRYQKRSVMNGDQIKIDDEVILLDTLGELSSFYPLATVAFVGGSLADAGGHNLLEPAMWKKPVFFGPFTGNMRETAEMMKSCGGGKEVNTEQDLFSGMLTVLKDPALAVAMGNQAYQVLEGNKGVLDRHLDSIEKCLQN